MCVIHDIKCCTNVVSTDMIVRKLRVLNSMILCIWKHLIVHDVHAQQYMISWWQHESTIQWYYHVLDAQKLLWIAGYHVFARRWYEFYSVVSEIRLLQTFHILMRDALGIHWVGTKNWSAACGSWIATDLLCAQVVINVCRNV